MNKQWKQMEAKDVNENVIAGIVGAFLFSLVGGILWFVIYLLGFIAGISGLIGAVCAIKGYSIFAKKESIKGIIISLVIAILVLVMAWYACLSYDVYAAYQTWFEEGEVDFTLTYFESVRAARYFLLEPEIGRPYFGDLALGLLFSLLGGGSYVFNKIKNIKNAKNAPAPAVTAEPVAKTAEEPVEEVAPETVAEAAEETKEEPVAEETKEDTVQH